MTDTGSSLRVAAVQLNANDQMEHNIERAYRLMQQAKSDGAELMVLPENAVLMQESGAKMKAASPLQQDHPAVARFAAIAKELGVMVVVGSIPVSVPNEERLANRCFVYDASGAIQATYDKIHLFDANPKEGESYTESRRYLAGDKAVCVDVPNSSLRLGLSICYDLRFPYLFRTLAQAGAQVMLVPSAFAYTTGSAHWHVLLRARAIETGSYVIAPAQCGMHPGGRRTYGHALIIDPWGRILAEASEAEEQVILADISRDLVTDIRQRLTAWQYHTNPLELKIF